jgi:S-adenosylmethionine hydrolase
MPMVPSLVALLTDFGLADPYVGAMKGAILSVCPAATLVDVGHEIPAHDVLAGALSLEAAVPFFPAGTIVVGVVDPGVGSSRRGLAIASDGRVFVGPDNGLFTLVMGAAPSVRVLENASLFRRPVSPVFHGRDVFGPVAGHLASGRALEEVGPAIGDPVRLALPKPRRAGDAFEGEVLHVDRFGNLTTNLTAAEVSAIGPKACTVVGGRVLPLVRAYSDVPPGAGLALLGSGDRLEVACNQGRANALLGAGRGALVRLTRAS